LYKSSYIIISCSFKFQILTINFSFLKSVAKKDGEEVTRAEMFIKTRQGRPTRKRKVVDEETLDAIVSLF